MLIDAVRLQRELDVYVRFPVCARGVSAGRRCVVCAFMGSDSAVNVLLILGGVGIVASWLTVRIPFDVTNLS